MDSGVNGTHQSSWIGTSNRGYAVYALEELRRLFSGIRFTYLIPNEVFIFEIAVPKEDAIASIRFYEPVFLRHVQPIDREWERHSNEKWNSQFESLLFQYIELLPDMAEGDSLAVQVRKTADVEDRELAYDMREWIFAQTEQSHSVVPAVRDTAWILSVFITSERLYIGCAATTDTLSDWSGGAIRFKKEEGQISRAKFKLLEAEVCFSLDFSRFTSALDVGAAPGGWSSLLLERGLEVTAVDPAKLDERLLLHPKLTFIRKNASDVKFREDYYDLLVCDMSWSPRQMTRLVNPLFHSLKAGGAAIITCKLMHKKPFRTIKEISQAFGQMELVKAKQLFHNRDEATLYFKKTHPESE